MWFRPSGSRSEGGSSSQSLRRKSSTGSSKSKHGTQSHGGGSSSRSKGSHLEDGSPRKDSTSRSRVLSDEEERDPPRSSASSRVQKAPITTAEGPTSSSRLEKASEPRKRSRTGPSQDHDLPSTVPNQFPDQAPQDWAMPFRPASMDQFGAAAEFYNDQGQSVQQQPGVRPATPIVTGSEPHLMAALPVAAPPQETGTGSAAEFYSGASGAPDFLGSSEAYTSHDAPSQIRPKPTKPPKPSSNQPSSGVPLAAATAAGASAAAYGYHQQHHTNSHLNSFTTSSKPSSRPPGIRPPALLSPASDPSASPDYQEQRQRRGAIGKFMDWWNDYDDVRRMEDYTEYIGVCKYCFDPNSSTRGAPRKHRPMRRRSREFGHRVDKESRYGRPVSSSSSASSDHGRDSPGLVGASLAGLGPAASGSSLKGSRSRADKNTRREQYEARAPNTLANERRKASSYSVEASNPEDLHQASRARTNHRGLSRREGRRSSPHQEQGLPYPVRAGIATSAAAGYAAPELPREYETRRKTPYSSKRMSGGQAQFQHRRNSSGSSSSSGSNGGIFSRIFSPRSSNDKKRKSRKSVSGVYKMKEPGRSTASDLAYHDDPALMRRNKTRRRSQSPMNATKAVAGLGAAAALMAAADSRRNKGSKMQPELVAVRESRSSQSTAHPNRLSSRVSVAEEWEDVSDTASASSSSSGLAFGAGMSAASSSDSVDSTDADTAVEHSSRPTGSRFTDPLNVSSRPRPSEPRPPGRALSIHEQYHAQSPQQPLSPSTETRPLKDRVRLQSLDPIPVAESHSSSLQRHSPPLRSRTRQLPLQQPQPILPIRPPSYNFESAINDVSNRKRRSPSPAEHDRWGQPSLAQAGATSKDQKSASARRIPSNEVSGEADDRGSSPEPARKSRRMSPPAEALPRTNQRHRGSGTSAGMAGVAAAGAVAAAAADYNHSRKEQTSPSPPHLRQSTYPTYHATSPKARHKQVSEASNRRRSDDVQNDRHQSPKPEKSGQSTEDRTARWSDSQPSPARGGFAMTPPSRSGSKDEQWTKADTSLSNVGDGVNSQQGADSLCWEAEAVDKGKSSHDDADREIDQGKNNVSRDPGHEAVQHEVREANIKSRAEELSSDEDIFDPNFFRMRRQSSKEASAEPLTGNDLSSRGEEQEAFAADSQGAEGLSRVGKETGGVPMINVIKPTPPQSVAGSVRDPHSRSASPLRQVFKSEDVRDPQDQPAKPKRRVTWGQDEFNIYQLESPDSARDEYFAPRQENAVQMVEDETAPSDTREGSESYHPPCVEPSISPDEGIVDADPLKGNDTPLLVLLDDEDKDDNSQPSGTSPVNHTGRSQASDTREDNVVRGEHSARSSNHDDDHSFPDETPMPGSFLEEELVDDVRVDTFEPSAQLHQPAADAEIGSTDIALLDRSTQTANQEESRPASISKDSQHQSKKHRKSKRKKSHQSAAEALTSEPHDGNVTSNRMTDDGGSYDRSEDPSAIPAIERSSKRRNLTGGDAPAEPQTKVGDEVPPKKKSGSLWGMFRRSGSEDSRERISSRNEVPESPGDDDFSPQRTKKSRRSSVAVDSSDAKGGVRRRRSDSTSSRSQASNRSQKRDPLDEPRRPRSEPPPSDEDSGRRSHIPIMQVNLSALGVESTPFRTIVADPRQDRSPTRRSARGTDLDESKKPVSAPLHAEPQHSDPVSDGEVDLPVSHSIDSLTELERDMRSKQSRTISRDEFEPPDSYEDVPEMIRLPESRPQSPYTEPASPVATSIAFDTPVQKYAHKPSNTSVPLRFRAPLSSPLAPRESVESSAGPSQTFNTSPTSLKRAVRASRPGSAEFRTSGEYRPLWLPSKYVAPAATEPEEFLPSLPSSRTSSEIGGDDTYESAVSSLRSSPHRQASEADTDAWHDFSSNASPRGEYLDSQQATPKAVVRDAQVMPEVPHFDLDALENHDQFSSSRQRDSSPRAANGVATLHSITPIGSKSRRASSPARTSSHSDDKRNKRSNSVAALAAATVGAAGAVWIGSGILGHATTGDSSPSPPSQHDGFSAASHPSAGTTEKERSSAIEDCFEGTVHDSATTKKSRPTPLEGLAMMNQPADLPCSQSSRTEVSPPYGLGSLDAQERDISTGASSSRTDEQGVESPLTARKSPDAQESWPNEAGLPKALSQPVHGAVSADGEVAAQSPKPDSQEPSTSTSRHDSLGSTDRALSHVHVTNDAGLVADAKAVPLPPDEDDELTNTLPPELETVQTASVADAQVPHESELSTVDAMYVESLVNKSDNLRASNGAIQPVSKNADAATSHGSGSDIDSQAPGHQRTSEDVENPSPILSSQRPPVGDELGGPSMTSLQGLEVGIDDTHLPEDPPQTSSTFDSQAEEAEPIEDEPNRATPRKHKKKQKGAKKGKSPSADVGKSLATVEVDDGLAQGHTSRTVPIDVAQAAPVHPEHGLEAQMMVPRPENIDIAPVNQALDSSVAANEMAKHAHERGLTDEAITGTQPTEKQPPSGDAIVDARRQEEPRITPEPTHTSEEPPDVQDTVPNARTLSASERKKMKKKRKNQQVFDWKDDDPSAGASNQEDDGTQTLELSGRPETEAYQALDPLGNADDQGADLHTVRKQDSDSAVEPQSPTVDDKQDNADARGLTRQAEVSLEGSVESVLSDTGADALESTGKNTLNTEAQVEAREFEDEPVAVSPADENDSPRGAELNVNVISPSQVEDGQHKEEPDDSTAPESTHSVVAAEEDLDFAMPMSSKDRKKAKKAKQKAERNLDSTSFMPPPDAVAPDSKRGQDEPLEDDLPPRPNKDYAGSLPDDVAQETPVARSLGKKEGKKAREKAEKTLESLGAMPPTGDDEPEAGHVLNAGLLGSQDQAEAVPGPVAGNDQSQARSLSKKIKKKAKREAAEPSLLPQDVPDTEEVGHITNTGDEESLHDRKVSIATESADDEWGPRLSSKKEKKKAKKAKDKAIPTSKPEGYTSPLQHSGDCEVHELPDAGADIQGTQIAQNVNEHKKSHSSLRQPLSELAKDHAIDEQRDTVGNLPEVGEATVTDAQGWDLPRVSKEGKKKSRKAKKQLQWASESEPASTTEERTDPKIPALDSVEDDPSVSVPDVPADAVSAEDKASSLIRTSAAFEPTAGDIEVGGKIPSNEALPADVTGKERLDRWGDAARQSEGSQHGRSSSDHQDSSRGYDESSRDYKEPSRDYEEPSRDHEGPSQAHEPLGSGQQDDPEDRVLPSSPLEVQSSSDSLHERNAPPDGSHAGIRTQEISDYLDTKITDPEDPGKSTNGSLTATRSQGKDDVLEDVQDVPAPTPSSADESTDAKARRGMPQDGSTPKEEEQDLDPEVWHDTVEAEVQNTRPTSSIVSSSNREEEAIKATESARGSDKPDAEVSSESSLPAFEKFPDNEAEPLSSINAGNVTKSRFQPEVDDVQPPEPPETEWSLKAASKKDKKKAKKSGNLLLADPLDNVPTDVELREAAASSSKLPTQDETSDEQARRAPSDDDWTLSPPSKKDKKKAKSKPSSTPLLPIAAAGAAFVSEAVDSTGDAGKWNENDIQAGERVSGDELLSKPSSKKDKKKGKKGKKTFASEQPSPKVSTFNAAELGAAATDSPPHAQKAAREENPSEELTAAERIIPTTDNEDKDGSTDPSVDDSTSRSLRGSNNVASAAQAFSGTEIMGSVDANEEEWVPGPVSKKNKKKARKDTKAKVGDVVTPSSKEATLPIFTATEGEQRDGTSDATGQAEALVPEVESVTEDRPMRRTDKERGERAKQQVIGSSEVQHPRDVSPPIQSAKADAVPKSLLDDTLGKSSQIVSETEVFPLSKKEKKKKAKNLRNQEQLLPATFPDEPLGPEQAGSAAAGPIIPDTEDLEDPSLLRRTPVEPISLDIALSEPTSPFSDVEGDHNLAPAHVEGESRTVNLDPGDSLSAGLMSQEHMLGSPSRIDASETQADRDSDRQPKDELQLSPSSPFQTDADREQAAVSEDSPLSNNMTGILPVLTPEQVSTFEMIRSPRATSPNKPETAANDQGSTTSVVTPDFNISTETMLSLQPAKDTDIDTVVDSQSTIFQDVSPAAEASGGAGIPGEVRGEHQNVVERMPSTDDTLANETPTNEPAANEPAGNETPTNKTPANEPAGNETPTDKIPANEPATNEPATNQPTTNEPAINEPAINEPAINEPAINEPAFNETPVNEPAANEPTTDETLMNKTPTNETPANEISMNETPANETPTNETPTNETPTNELPTSETTTKEPPANETSQDEMQGEQRQLEREEDIIAVDQVQPTQTDEDFWTSLPKSKAKKKAKKDKARQLEAPPVAEEAPAPTAPVIQDALADASKESPYTIAPMPKAKKKKGKKGKGLRVDEYFEETNVKDDAPQAGLQNTNPGNTLQQSAQPTEESISEPRPRDAPSDVSVGALDGFVLNHGAMPGFDRGDRQVSGREASADTLVEEVLEKPHPPSLGEGGSSPDRKRPLVTSNDMLQPLEPPSDVEGRDQDGLDNVKPHVEGLEPRTASTTEGYVTVADLEEQLDSQEDGTDRAMIEVTPAEAVNAPMSVEAAPKRSASEGDDVATPQEPTLKSKKLSKKEKRKGKKEKHMDTPLLEEHNTTVEADESAMGGEVGKGERGSQDTLSDRVEQAQSSRARDDGIGESAVVATPSPAMHSDAMQLPDQSSRDSDFAEAQKVVRSSTPQTYGDHEQPPLSPKSQRSQSPSQLWGSNFHMEDDAEREHLLHGDPGTEDADFAATLAAGLQHSGFDPELAISSNYQERGASASPYSESEARPPQSRSSLGGGLTGTLEAPPPTRSLSRFEEEVQENNMTSNSATGLRRDQADESEFDDAVRSGLREGGFDLDHASQLRADDALAIAQHDQGMAQSDDKPLLGHEGSVLAAPLDVTDVAAMTGDSNASKRSKKKSKKSKKQQPVKDEIEIAERPFARDGLADAEDGASRNLSRWGISPNDGERTRPQQSPTSLWKDSQTNAAPWGYEPIRDSGYQGSIPEAPVLEDKRFSSHDALGNDRSSPSPSVEPTPAKRGSSDVDSTSKERTSALFRSPPAPPSEHQGQSPPTNPRRDASLTTSGLEDLEEGRGVNPFEVEDDYRAACGSELEPIQEDNTEQIANEEHTIGLLSGSRAVSVSDQSKADLSPGIAHSSYVSPSTSEIANTRRRYRRSSSIESKDAIRPSSVLSARARTPGSVVSQRSITPTLHRSNPSSDLGVEYKRGSGLAPSQPQSSDLDFDTALSNDGRKRRRSYDPLKGNGRDRRAMSSDQGVYEGYGDVRETPRSPSRPQSLRKRQSMQIVDLENRLEQAIVENDNLKQSRGLSGETRVDGARLAESLRARDEQLRERDVEINSVRSSLDTLQHEVTRLSEHNAQLSAAHAQFSNNADERSAVLEAERDHAHSQWQASSRELDQVRDEHGGLKAGMEAAVEREISAALSEKNAEIKSLRAQLDSATQKIRNLQEQILASKTGEPFLNYRDEDYFESACAQLCQHVQAWVLRFSKFSDMRFCRSLSELHDETIENRLDNAVLDGTDVDQMLADRVMRRDVFMSVVMTLIWEFVFTRYLFGMDREQRQKLKNLEKILSEVGPQSAVAQWRATTLTLLARRIAFAEQRSQDTEAVVQEIYSTLAAVLPPPQNLIHQIQESLRNVMRLAVDLSIDMRTQRPEYMMLPPLRPEYDANGDLAKKVYFNAGLMNERSDEFQDNEELEDRQATVRLVLFPLVVRRGDDKGEGTEEIVISPAQVHISKEITRRDKRGLMVGGHANKSAMSIAAPSVLSGGDMV